MSPENNITDREDHKNDLPKNILDDDKFLTKKDEWEKIDGLVSIFQKSFNEDATAKEKLDADKAATELINLFSPFFHKYLVVITTGDIDWKDYEQKLFVSMFMDSPVLRSALWSKKRISEDKKIQIIQRFNFIKETYGHNENEYILTDLYTAFMVLVGRYKKTNRSFCCYLYNVFRYEMFRHIQKLLKNPLNIHYKSISYDLEFPTLRKIADNCDMDEKISIDEKGLPSVSWMLGQNCSEDFKTLTPLERKIISKYYIEQKTDKLIAEELGIHMNTCNNKRHTALNKIAKAKNINIKNIKRCRNSLK